jgi:hypothetical protein
MRRDGAVKPDRGAALSTGVAAIAPPAYQRSGLGAFVELGGRQAPVTVGVKLLETVANGWQCGGFLGAELAIGIGVGPVKGGCGR